MSKYYLFGFGGILLAICFFVSMNAFASAELVLKNVTWVDGCVNLSVGVSRLYGRDAFSLPGCGEDSPYFFRCNCSGNFTLGFLSNDSFVFNKLNANVYDVRLNYTVCEYNDYSSRLKFTDKGGWWNVSLDKRSFVPESDCGGVVEKVFVDKVVERNFTVWLNNTVSVENTTRFDECSARLVDEKESSNVLVGIIVVCGGLIGLLIFLLLKHWS